MEIRKTVHIPLLVMGYFNPMLQYGVEEFCKTCAEIGIDGLIMPDLPYAYWEEHYKEIYEKHNLQHVQLITPQTSKERVFEIDKQSQDGFIYMVSSSATTGSQKGFQQEQLDYFKRIDSYNLTSPRIVGFGIKDATTFVQATSTSKGAIIGSAFIKMLSSDGKKGISKFIQSIR